MCFQRKIIALIICIGALTGVSCENWLDVSPKSEVKYDDMFNTKNGVKDQLIGLYTGLASEDVYGTNLSYGMTDVLGQYYFWDMEIGKYYYLDRYNYSHATSEGIIETIWSRMYNLIANTNILIQGLEEHPAVLSPEEHRVVEGESYAIRALLHFDLLRLFGKSYAVGANENAIPYVNKISKEVTPLSTVTGVFDAVINDLKKAETLLQDDPIRTKGSKNSFLGNRSFHLNYYAVQALLARVYLYKNDKANAYSYAQKVINSAAYKWIPREEITTSTRETRNGIFSSESIFSLNNTKIEDLVGRYLREGQNADQNNLLLSNLQTLNSVFELDYFGGFDWRYIYFIEGQRGRYYANTKLWQFRYMPIQYKNIQPILKWSEMFLIAAEAAPSKKEALGFLNALRQHRGFDPSLDFTETISNENLQLEIGKEYRKEFFGEGQWFFYCKRLDVIEIPNSTVAFSKSYYVLPLPSREIEYGDR